MTTLSKEDVVLLMEKSGFNSWVRGEGKSNEEFCMELATLARADLVDENERLKREDFCEMRQMLRAMQAGELTVSRGLEILNMWWAGNWNDNMLPPVRQDLIEEDFMPVEIIDRLNDKLTATRTALAAAEAREGKLLSELENIKVFVQDTDGGRWLYERILSSLMHPRDNSALHEMITGVYEECAAKLKSKHDYECSAAAHHAKSFYAAYGYHMTRQAAVSECLYIIRALAEKKLASLTS